MQGLFKTHNSYFKFPQAATYILTTLNSESYKTTKRMLLLRMFCVILGL